MATRSKTQGEHDSVVAASAHTYSEQERRGYLVSTNPGSEKNQSVGPRDDPQYPDVVVWKPNSPGSTSGTATVIEEIETSESVNEDEGSQWKKYASLGVSIFRLIVPKADAAIAKKIIENKKIGVSEIWSYTINGGRISFDKFHVFSS